jgi:hypothetical protein
LDTDALAPTDYANTEKTSGGGSVQTLPPCVMITRFLASIVTSEVGPEVALVGMAL